jgi:hypothetical protein
MLLMDIITWEPKDSARVGNLYKDYEYPKGMKVIDEWIDLTGYRMFVIYETDDKKIYAPSVSPFIGLCRFETIPVMKAEKYMQMAQKSAEITGGKKFGAEMREESREKELVEQIENLEKRVQRLEHHSFIQEGDVT